MSIHFLIFTGIFLAGSLLSLPAQTVLQPGDLAILSVNANNRLCNPANDADDLISFVCFKDITPGTRIEITDNGWERALPGRWGNSEGTISLTRTGPAIPAGTVITLSFPPVGTAKYAVLAPDTNWTIQQLTLNAININSNGDQFYFMQGGVWNSVDTGFLFFHRATYTGGRILFGFNTKQVWTGFLNSSQESGLHPEVASCFHMEPTGNTTDYIVYTGSFAPATQLEWIQRIATPANWRSFSNCNTLPALPPRIDILPSGIALECANCRGCAPFDATLRFRLPAVGGPFKVTFTNGRDTFQRGELISGALIPVFTDSTRTFSIISVENAQGCPVYSDFGDPVRVVIERPTLPGGIFGVSACAQPDGQSEFNLSQLDMQLSRNGPDLRVQWFLDSLLQMPISNPALFRSPAGRVFATISDSVCSAIPAPVLLELRQPPTATLPADGSICSGTPCLPLEFGFQGSGPFTLNYSLQLPGANPENKRQTFSSPGERLNICPGQLGITRGTIVLQYQTLTDRNGCTTTFEGASTALAVGLPIVNTVRQTLCSGESIRVNGRTYDENTPRDSILLPNAAAGGCDSLIIVDLSFQPPIFAGLSGDTSACPGQNIALKWELSGGQSFRIVYREGETIRELQGVRHGDILRVRPQQNTLLVLLSIVSEDSRCEIRPFSAYPLYLNDLSVSAQALPKFGGNAISCHNAADGEAIARIAGGVAPYRITWSTGAPTETISGLRAGAYSVSVTDAQGCSASSQTAVTQPGAIVADIEVTPARCARDSSRFLLKQLSGGTGPFLYSLDGQSFRILARLPLNLRNLAPGSYTFSLQDANGCPASFPFSVPAPRILTASLGPNRTIRAGDSLRIAPVFNFTPVLLRWTPEVPPSASDPGSFILRPSISTNYRIEATDSSGCVAVADLSVLVEQKQQFFTPNAFSPNGDNINDRLQFFLGPEIVRIESLRVFNRWGVQVFEAAQAAPGSPESEWDGLINGQPAPTGVYVYTAVLETRDGKLVQEKGDVLLKR